MKTTRLHLHEILIATLSFIRFGTAHSFMDEPTKPSACQDYEVSCANGIGCLHPAYLCNGETECTDGSDESPEWCKNNCNNLWNMFTCDDNSCVPRKFVCDGAKACADGSDESFEICANCFGDRSKIKCRNGTRCVDKNFMCDSDLDCGSVDLSDEDPVICSENCGGLPDRFQCTNKKCINNYKICDGQADCEDGSDETTEMCQNCNGDSERFKCKISGKCIWVSDVCNESDDCSITNIFTAGSSVVADTSDEQNCPKKMEPSVYRYSWEGKK